jgi:hypothetical protein
MEGKEWRANDCPGSQEKATLSTVLLSAIFRKETKGKKV